MGITTHFKLSIMKQEFSKEKMLTDLDNLIKQLEKNEGFDVRYGWQQVDGKGEAKNRAYGQLDAYLALWYIITGDIYQF
jgi:hypothetical protein